MSEYNFYYQYFSSLSLITNAPSLRGRVVLSTDTHTYKKTMCASKCCAGLRPERSIDLTC